MYWGYSPAVDIQDEVKHSGSWNDSTTVINVLLIGSCDARHILKTLGQMYRHSAVQINFYIMEGSIELIARQLLLLSVALEPPDVLGSLEKARTFMELYGNIIIRPNTARYLSRKGTEWIDMITDEDLQQKRMPMVNLNYLKYKERDYLQNIFKFWEKFGNDIFNPSTHWDSRIRKQLGVRYDAKDGAFDWDYHMRLHNYGGSKINPREYKHWRKTGVAFTWLESHGSVPNCSLASGVVLVGDKLCHHGYLGDIVNSPYVNYGLDCEDKDMLKEVNGVNVKRATDITERNLARIFFELQEQKLYVHESSSEDLGVIITEITEAELEKMNGGGNSLSFSNKDKSVYSFLSVRSAQIYFLPLSAINSFPMKEKYNSFFDVVFISQLLFQHFNPEVLKMAKNGALALIESRLFVLSLRKDDLEIFGKTLLETAKSCDCVLVTDYNPLKNSVAKFIIRRPEIS